MRHSVSFPKKFSSYILALTTDQAQDFHLERSTPSLSLQQKKFLKQQTGHTFKKIFNIQQVHGRRVVLAGTRQKKIPKADAVITNKPQLALTVRTADCLPIFLFDPKHQAIGLIHAGWRSTKKKIVTHTLKRMKRHFGTRPQELKVAFGPALQKCCFEVGPEFKRYFPGHVREHKGQLTFDIAGTNQAELIKNGVFQRNIFDCALCTFCQKRFFSFRRQGAKAGRMLSILMLEIEETALSKRPFTLQ